MASFSSVVDSTAAQLIGAVAASVLAIDLALIAIVGDLAVAGWFLPMPVIELACAR